MAASRRATLIGINSNTATITDLQQARMGHLYQGGIGKVGILGVVAPKTYGRLPPSTRRAVFYLEHCGKSTPDVDT
jgi:hypothetical protein